MNTKEKSPIVQKLSGVGYTDAQPMAIPRVNSGSHLEVRGIIGSYNWEGTSSASRMSRPTPYNAQDTLPAPNELSDLFKINIKMLIMLRNSDIKKATCVGRYSEMKQRKLATISSSTWIWFSPLLYEGNPRSITLGLSSSH